MLFPAKVELKPDIFKLIRDFIHKTSGVYFEENKKFLLETKLQKRLMELKLQNFYSYYRYLTDNFQTECGVLFNAITTNETFFFREAYHYESLKDILTVKKMEDNEKRKFRIWSAGCSSGEEAYSIKMSLSELNGQIDYEIFASDISEEMIDKARNQLYREYSFRMVPENKKNLFFDRVNGTYKIKSILNKNITFKVLNLFDKSEVDKLGKFDIIFCRNVIIYFSEDKRTELIESFYNRLNNNGYLFLGHSESLHRITTAFKPVRVGKSMIYVKE